MDIETDAPVTGAEEFDLDAAVGNAYDSVTAEETEQPEAPQEATEEITDQGTTPEPEAETPIEAPKSWSAEAKEQFAKLPPETQKYVAARESERETFLTQKSQEIADQRKQFEAFEQILAPRRQALTMQYGSEQAAMDQLFKISDYATSDPAGFIQWFAKERGIDLGQPAQHSDVDPVVQQVQQQVQQINQQLQTTQQQNITNMISSFKAERDEAGAVKYPLFEQVQMDMAQLLNSGQAADLPAAYALGVLRNAEAREKLVPDMPHINDVQNEMANLIQKGLAKSTKHAYEMAVWNNSTVRERMLEDRKKAEDAKLLDNAKNAASKAEKAKGITAKSRKDGTAAPVKNSNWEDTLGEVYERVVGE
jgi:hypothetical protein